MRFDTCSLARTSSSQWDRRQRQRSRADTRCAVQVMCSVVWFRRWPRNRMMLVLIESRRDESSAVGGQRGRARGGGPVGPVMIYVQHLLGIGHQRRAAAIARALCKRALPVCYVSGGM